MKTDDRGDDDRDVGGCGENNVKCSIENKRCVTHQCGTKSIKVTNKKWDWIEKKKQFGYTSKKTTKYICLVRISGQGTPSVDNSGVSMRGELSGNAVIHGEVGRFSSNKEHETRSRSDLRKSLENSRKF